MEVWADNMLINYVNYLNFLNEKLRKFFASQKPYIFCDKGCARCCKNAQFPYSSIEVTYLLAGFQTLDRYTQQVIRSNIQKTVNDKKIFDGEKFLYDCPFLINDVCAVYDFRGVVCRTFGLLSQGNDGRIKVPFCCYQGFNYSNILDMDTKKLSQEKIDKLHLKEEPVAFNVSYEFLTDPAFEYKFKFLFGDKKPLIDWFLDK